MIKITFPDGNIKEYEKNITLMDIAKGISPSLAKNCYAGKVNEKLVDMSTPITEDATIKLFTDKDEETFEILNHSSAHVLALAVKRLFPNAKFGVGPAIDGGFYYDIDAGNEISEHDLVKLEKEMTKIASEAHDFTSEKLSYEQAKELFKDDEYKLYLIEQINNRGDEITTYTCGEFTDLCRGVHVPNTNKVKHVKLLRIAGAYWLGNNDNKMLQRIYGVTYFTKQDLGDYLNLIEEAKKRDHRKIGQQLDLFFTSEYGPGFPFFMPNGMTVKNELLKYWNSVHERENYQMIQTPMMLNKELWEISGHWFNYKENMYLSEVDDKEFAIKPMNCPGGMIAYNHRARSYKELPLRMGELGTVHRHEASGALHGLLRVRFFTQDDAHIFMREEQIEDEVIKLIDLYKEIYNKFGLDFHIELSTKPEKAIGSDEVWEVSEKALANACKKGGYEYILNPGDGAFYGPKLDFKLKDSLGRIWQCGTIQLDYNLPERFDVSYIAKDGSKQRPVMLHRALLGSIERFIGIITEHYAGAFPTWLAPNQVRVIPVSNKIHAAKVEEIVKELHDLGIRVDSDTRDEKMGKKIREAQVNKIPYTIIVGDNELETGNITYRPYGVQETTSGTKEEFTTMILKEINERINNR